MDLVTNNKEANSKVNIKTIVPKEDKAAKSNKAADNNATATRSLATKVATKAATNNIINNKKVVKVVKSHKEARRVAHPLLLLLACPLRPLPTPLLLLRLRLNLPLKEAVDVEVAPPRTLLSPNNQWAVESLLNAVERPSEALFRVIEFVPMEHQYLGLLGLNNMQCADHFQHMLSWIVKLLRR